MNALKILIPALIVGTSAAYADPGADDVRFATARAFADLAQSERLAHFTPMIQTVQNQRQAAGQTSSCAADADVGIASLETAAYVEQNPYLNELPVAHVIALALSVACPSE